MEPKQKISSQMLDNSKSVLSNIFQFWFFLKLISLFILYLITNFLFDRINTGELKPLFESDGNNKTLNIELPNNIIFKLLITIIMIISSSFIYTIFFKPFSDSYFKSRQ
jgi:hypothetical protein